MLKTPFKMMKSVGNTINIVSTAFARKRQAMITVCNVFFFRKDIISAEQMAAILTRRHNRADFLKKNKGRFALLVQFICLNG